MMGMGFGAAIASPSDEATVAGSSRESVMELKSTKQTPCRYAGRK